jgi:hypothetical protein
MELADSTGLTYIWWYAVPGDDGTREEGKRYTAGILLLMKGS